MELEHIACNLCGRDDAALLFSRRDELTGHPLEFRVVRCRGCGLVYVDPRPTAALIGRFYPPEFVSYQFESLPAGADADLSRKVLSLLSNTVAGKRVSAVRRMHPLGPGQRVIDIGCGKGSFLARLARDCGCEVTGVDFDAESVRYCRDALGIETVLGGTRELGGLDGRFDVVTMWHFLEHEYDPGAALAAAARLLRPGGVLVVEVPNVASLECTLFGRRSYLYDVPRHLYGFTPDTLRRMVEAAGLAPRHIAFPLQSGGWVGSLQSVLSGGAVFRDLRRNLLPFLLLAPLALLPDALAALAGRGSIMTLFAGRSG